MRLSLRQPYWIRATLWLVLALLPLQGTVAWLGAWQGQRHVHLAAAAEPSSLLGDAAALLRDWVGPQRNALFAAAHAALGHDHVHDGTPHHHPVADGALALGEPEGDGGGSASALGLALLPGRWSVPVMAAGALLVPSAALAWLSHAGSVPRRPPRGG